ncbi:MAG: TIGR04552 family protein [Rhodobacterales bacterium]|nr:TIGR04552 family protein [Rhodobacterales bacterium]
MRAPCILFCMRRDILELDTSYDRANQAAPISLEDIEAVRLMLSGGSVVDWQRLAFRDVDAVDRFLKLLCLEPDLLDDQERIRFVYNESVSYLEEHLHLRFPGLLRNPIDVRDVFLSASQFGGFRRTQILSCVILKLMHVIHHMEAADLKYKTPVSEEQFLELAHKSILKQARLMQNAGLNLISFYGSRKSRSSVITKLLAKKDNIAATIFDKLRFRIVVESPSDLAPAMAWLKNNVFAFNYVIPHQAHNNLLDPDHLVDLLDNADELERALYEQEIPTLEESNKNEFSGDSYRMINFIVDYPVRIPNPQTGTRSFELGNVVFVMVEFQLLDEETARLNESGENAHSLYKDRQHQVVARRLKRGGRKRRS